MQKTKNTIRIATQQYCYIETEFEGTADEAITEHNRLVLKYKLSIEGETLPEKDWKKTLDRFLTTNKMESDMWEKMSTSQKYIINEIKKSVKRMDKEDRADLDADIINDILREEYGGDADVRK